MSSQINLVVAFWFCPGNGKTQTNSFLGTLQIQWRLISILAKNTLPKFSETRYFGKFYFNFKIYHAEFCGKHKW